MATGGYRSYRGFEEMTGLERTTGDDKRFQGFTEGYRGLQGVTAGYKGLQRVTMGYRGLQGVTVGYKG